MSFSSSSISPASIAVLIASRRRPGELSATVDSIRRQTYKPVQIILSVFDESDVSPQLIRDRDVTICMGNSGNPVQLNAGLKLLVDEVSVISILDDDVELSRNYLKGVVRAFRTNPGLVGVDASLLANGNISRQGAINILTHYDAEHSEVPEVSDLKDYRIGRGLYGCCMSFRRTVLDLVQFDERLPLYAWLGDTDMSIRAQRYGRCAQLLDTCLVHLAVSSGKLSGKRFGYSQIMNPVYLAKKGVLTWTEVFKVHLLKCFAGNMVGLLRRDKNIDRASRLAGNMIAVTRLLSGKVDPEYILSIDR
jgi:GT2 family glycosyltransferase